MRTDGPRSVKGRGEDWRGEYPPPDRSRGRGGPPWGLIVTGLVVLGVGMMAWNYLGPDLRRYLKIERM
jgi:hypothetical protein